MKYPGCLIRFLFQHISYREVKAIELFSSVNLTKTGSKFFEDGEILYLIHRQNYADDGDLVLLRTENGAFIGQYRQSGEFAVFIPEGVKSNILTVSEERVSEFTAGVAVEVRRKLN